jgi:hypothetical protein
MRKYENFYLKYKRLLLPVLFAALAVFMVFFVIFPQISSISNLSNDISAASERVQTLKVSLDTIASQNEAELDSKLSTATDALPTVKDISRIFSTLNSAAAASNTSLREFSLEVGGVHGKAAEVTGDLPTAPSMSVVARVEGDIRSLSEFGMALSRKFPLSEVSKIDGSGDTASFQIAFFYKPVNMSMIAEKDNVSALSPADSEFLNKINLENNK